MFALAIEPLTIAFTTTGRKAYDVMLWLAQRSPSAPDGGYSSPVSAILKGYGSTTKASERVQRYIEQMEAGPVRSKVPTFSQLGDG